MAKAKKKKAITKKATPKKVVAKKAAAKKSAPKKAVTKKATVKKSAVKKTAAPKTTKKVAAKTKTTPQKSSQPSAKKSASNEKTVNLDLFMTPLDDRLVVQTFSAERVTAGGLIIPATVSQMAGNKEGTVVAVGRGHRNKKGRVHAMDVKKGDRVIFPEYAGNEIEFQKTKLIIIRESDVLGILDRK